jgi:hypothetical protein
MIVHLFDMRKGLIFVLKSAILKKSDVYLSSRPINGHAGTPALNTLFGVATSERGFFAFCNHPRNRRKACNQNLIRGIQFTANAASL